MEPIDYVNSLYSGASQIQNFQTQREIWPTARMSASPNPRPFPKGAPMALPATYTYGGATRICRFHERHRDHGARRDQGRRIRHESYADWGGPDTHWVSMSIAKSFVSAVLGIALDEGRSSSRSSNRSTTMFQHSASRVRPIRTCASRTSCRCRPVPAGTRITATPIPT